MLRWSQDGAVTHVGTLSYRMLAGLVCCRVTEVALDLEVLPGSLLLPALKIDVQPDVWVTAPRSNS
ncbi:hypothetical protein ABIB49_003482 [Arthrobacter sp. UYCu512]